MENKHEKIKLKEIDREYWKFILYETPDEKWIGYFTYSPTSFVDLSMYIILSNEKKLKAKKNRDYLIELSENVRNNYKKYLKKSIDEENFIIS